MSKRHHFKPFSLQNISIDAAAAEGKAIAKHDGKVIFVPFAAPGDVVDLLVDKQKKSYAEAKITHIHKASAIRTTPQCVHFGICGGCKWQHVQYPEQLKFKAAQAENDMQRIAKVEVKNYQDILGSDPIYQYRNKLEFTFSNKAWEANFDKNNPGRIPALGFHIPGMFDKVLDLEHCQLAPQAANTIRQTIKAKAIEMGLEFFDIRQQTGFLRNLMLRSNHKGEWLLVLVVAQHKTQLIEALFDAVMPELNMVSEWCYVINTKANDTWSDLPVETYKGQGHLIEQLEDLTFTIRPQSFFQTNTKQALALYQITRDFANIQQHETVYDLYTGTGTIALFVAKQAKQVIGIEYVEAAIIDAKNNAQLNQIDNTHFYAGDMKLVLNDDLIQKHGKADVVITDPPRDGMHPSVVQKIIELGPNRIVYVSCNTSTQARDIALLSEHYEVDCLKTVDMFPHTHHVESVALLIKKA